MGEDALFAEARRSFHAALLSSVLRQDAAGIPSNADKDSAVSRAIARGILDRIGIEEIGTRLAGQRAGSKFEAICRDFLDETFSRLAHLRPGRWEVRKGFGGRDAIAEYDQYEHLAALDEAARENPQLAAALGSDYLIKPDVVVTRVPEDDPTINANGALVDERHARLTPLRRLNTDRPSLHASVSCKWTLRSDRAQNARSEALNLVRNRKGRLPHIVVVTGEPMPSRIASIALGTGDIDCVYHFALPELLESVRELDQAVAEDLTHTMIDGKRLRDISDLPLDLAV